MSDNPDWTDEDFEKAKPFAQVFPDKAGKMSDGLKPCPFCKKAMVKGLSKRTGCQLHGDPIQYVRLYCGNHQCPVRPSIEGGCRFRGMDEPIYEVEERAKLAARWNDMLRADMLPPNRDVFMNVLVSLVAAVSLLKGGGKKAAPSDKMFNAMIADYEKAIESGRAYLKAGEGE